MKRRLIIVAIVIALFVAVAVPLQQNGVFRSLRRRFSAPVGQTVFVIPSNAPGWMRVGGPGRYLCDGTKDEVEIQTAINAMSTIGGVVQLQPGTLSVTKPTGAFAKVDVVADTITLTNGSHQCTLTNMNYTTGTHANVAVGQQYRLTAGDDGEGNTIEDNAEDVIGTVTAVSSGPNTITFSEQMGEDYTAVVLTRVIGAVEMKQKVTLRGSGIGATIIELADDSDCSVITFEPATNQVLWSIEDLQINGNSDNQGDDNVANFDPVCNGIVANVYAWDVHYKNLSVIACKGDVVWITFPWGHRWFGGWIEHSTGTGLVLGNGGGGFFSGLKIAENTGGLWLRDSTDNTIMARLIEAGDTGGTGANAIKFSIASHDNRIVGVTIDAIAANNAGDAVVIDGSLRNLITGCRFNMTGNANFAVTCTGSAYGNVIVGNTLNTTGNFYEPYTGFAQWNYVDANMSSNGVGEKEVIHTRVAKNVSGAALEIGEVVVRTTDQAADYGTEVKASTTEGDSNVLGVSCTTPADDATGPIQTRGFTPYLQVDGTDNIAVGNFVSTFTGGVGQKAHSGHVAFAIALELYETDDSAGVIDALLIAPVVVP